MDLGLEGKVALVTGVAKPKGIGRAVALTLAEEGASIACIDIDLDGAESVAKQIQTKGRPSLAIAADQSKYQQIKEAVSKCQAELGPIDILVNNAAMMGVFHYTSKIDVSRWDQQIMVNLYGPFYWVRETFDAMVDKKWGRIISISSVAAKLGGFGQCSYSASKGGLISLMKTVALEGARFGITANIISLGSIATDSTNNIRPDIQERIIKRVPMRRQGNPQEVADIVVFLASGRAQYITGEDIVVDGGLSLFSF